jgi:DNA-binding transcriptional ArsR family regulator
MEWSTCQAGSCSASREAGLVDERPQGRLRVYSLIPWPLREISDWVGHYEQFWPERLRKLGEHLRKKS